MLEMFIKYVHLLTGVERHYHVEATNKFNVCYMELKMVSRVLIMPSIEFCESKT